MASSPDKSKQKSLHLMKRGMDLAGAWRHEEALEAYDRALALTPRGLFAKMLWELKGNTLRVLGRDHEAEEAYAQAQFARDPAKS